MRNQHVGIAAIAIVVSISVGAAQQTADTVLYNGKILTVDSDFNTAQAVAVRSTKIAAVGTDNDVLKLAGPNTLRIEHPAQYGLEYLDDAEVYEPEFNEPKYITFHEIKSKLRILETSRFFDSPRTVTETVEQLREYGWATSSLDVSKALAKMASSKEIMKNSHENRTHYFVQEPLVSN